MLWKNINKRLQCGVNHENVITKASEKGSIEVVKYLNETCHITEYLCYKHTAHIKNQNYFYDRDRYY